MPVAIGEDVRVEDDVFGREADLVDQDVVGALADLDLAVVGVGLALLVEGHHHRRRRRSGGSAGLLAGTASSPSFIEIELTMPLPCMHLQAGLDHLPLGASRS